MKPLLLLTFILCLFLCACDDGDVKTKEVNTRGSIAVTLSTNHIDSLRDLVTTHYVVWRRGLKIKEFDVKDTVQSLGVATTESENDNGDTQNIVAPQDYDFFVTVK